MTREKQRQIQRLNKVITLLKTEPFHIYEPYQCFLGRVNQVKTGLTSGGYDNDEIAKYIGITSDEANNIFIGEWNDLGLAGKKFSDYGSELTFKDAVRLARKLIKRLEA